MIVIAQTKINNGMFNETVYSNRRMCVENNSAEGKNIYNKFKVLFLLLELIYAVLDECVVPLHLVNNNKLLFVKHSRINAAMHQQSF